MGCCDSKPRPNHKPQTYHEYQNKSVLGSNFSPNRYSTEIAPSDELRTDFDKIFGKYAVSQKESLTREEVEKMLWDVGSREVGRKEDHRDLKYYVDRYRDSSETISDGSINKL